MENISIEEARVVVRQCGGCVGDASRRGEGWTFLFILDSRGFQIGRLTFKDDKLGYVKSYKRDYHSDVDETDLIFMRISKFVESGKKTLIPTTVFWSLWEKAQQTAKDATAEMRAWRECNPPTINPVTGKPRKRRRLEGRNPRTILTQLVNEY